MTLDELKELVSKANELNHKYIPLHLNKKVSDYQASTRTPFGLAKICNVGHGWCHVWVEVKKIEKYIKRCEA